MFNLIRALMGYLNGVRRVGAVALEQVTLDALESFEDLVKQIMTVTVVVMVVALTISGFLGAALAALGGSTIIAKVFLVLMVLVYFGMMAWLIRSGNALRSAGLLIGTDLAYGIARTGVPISPNDFRNIVRLNFDDDRLRRLASLQLAARTLFDIVIFETLILVAFTLVGVWIHPGWAVIVLVVGFVSAVLYTPYGQKGVYKGFAPLLLVIAIAIYGMMAWSEIQSNWEYIYGPFVAWRWWQFVLLILATSVTLKVLSKSESSRVKFWAKMVAVPLLILGLYGWASCLSFGISEAWKSATPSVDAKPTGSTGTFPAMATPADSISQTSPGVWQGTKSMTPFELTCLRVTKGQTITVTATGQGVWKNIPKGNPTAFEQCGPDGTSPNASSLMTPAEYWSNIGSYRCSKAQKGALIGRYNNGPWFPVGSNFKGEVKEDSEFVLGINDLKPELGAANWADDSGGFQFAINIQ